MKFRNSVLATRESRGISQHDLSRITGLSRVTIRSVERDDGYVPSRAVMAKLSEALGSGDALFWFENDREAVAV